MLKKNKHKIIIYSSVKLSKLVNSPLFRTSRYLDWLIKGHTLKCTGTWGLTYVRPLSHGDPTTVSFFLGAAKFLSERLSKRSSLSQNKKKKILKAPVGMMTNANGDWLTTKCTSTLLENVSRDGIRVSERRAQISASPPPPACQLWCLE